MPPKRRAPARGAGKKAADATGDRDILVIEVIEGPAKGTKFTPTVRIHPTAPTSTHPHPPFPLFPLKRVRGLTFISPPSSRQTQADKIQVGRTRSSQIYIKGDPAVSQKHASITWNGSAWQIVDLGSSNGTAVNDEDLEEDGDPTVLADGDVVSVGTDTTVVVSITKQSAKAAPEEPVSKKETAKEKAKPEPKKRGRPPKKAAEVEVDDAEPPKKKPAARGRKKKEPEPVEEPEESPPVVEEPAPVPEPVVETPSPPVEVEVDEDDDKENDVNVCVTVEQFIAEKVEGFISAATDVATEEVKELMVLKDRVKESIRKNYAQVEA
jgi:pSer/pThr/pTyr-binding forkhead associated (FHA) protein